jgi:hypothetical protein
MFAVFETVISLRGPLSVCLQATKLSGGEGSGSMMTCNSWSWLEGEIDITCGRKPMRVSRMDFGPAVENEKVPSARVKSRFHSPKTLIQTLSRGAPLRDLTVPRPNSSALVDVIRIAPMASAKQIWNSTWPVDSSSSLEHKCRADYGSPQRNRARSRQRTRPGSGSRHNLS